MKSKSKLEKIMFKTEKYETDEEFIAEWEKKASYICKPCWLLDYCPYGPLVEDFPLLPYTKAEAEHFSKPLEECLRTGKSRDGQLLDDKIRKFYEKDVAFIASRDQLDEIPQVFLDAKCHIFGHMCPVYFVAESANDADVEEMVVYEKGGKCKVVQRDVPIYEKCNEEEQNLA
jgi:hypothetical protein